MLGFSCWVACASEEGADLPVALPAYLRKKKRFLAEDAELPTDHVIHITSGSSYEAAKALAVASARNFP